MQRHSEEGGVHECVAEEVYLVVGLIGEEEVVGP